MAIAPGDRARNRNLDLLRAIAITMVVVYHTAHTTPSLRPVTNYGEYGVDLFFVLSGWLVGGLYWRERFSFGNVRIVGFWIRRWLAKRIDNGDVLQAVAQHTLTYPVEHGARVVLPELVDDAPLFYSARS